MMTPVYRKIPLEPRLKCISNEFIYRKAVLAISGPRSFRYCPMPVRYRPVVATSVGTGGSVFVDTSAVVAS
jgi:hypothetical protein